MTSELFFNVIGKAIKFVINMFYMMVVDKNSTYIWLSLELESVCNRV